MKIKTSELEGAALDWAVASIDPKSEDAKGYSPSTDWSQGGPLIESHKLEVGPSAKWFSLSKPWFALTPCGAMQHGRTPLIAAMRAIVAAELGDTVDVPEELLS